MRLDNQDGVSLTTETSDANPNASLSQDWLDVADAEERVMRNLPRVVASLPSTRRDGNGKRKPTRANKSAFLRVASAYTATFLLGGVCVAFGGRFFNSESGTVANEPTQEQIAESSAEQPDLLLDSLAFERRQEAPRVVASEPSNSSPLRFNDDYGSYVDETPSASDSFAPQNDVSNDDANGLPQVAREEETFPTWADLESNEPPLPEANPALPVDDYALASNPSPAPYEVARPNESFRQNYPATAPVAPEQTSNGAGYAQNPNSSLQLSAPSTTQYAAGNVRNDYNQNNNYPYANVVNSNANGGVYATNSGNNNYNNNRELDDFATPGATNEGFGSYSMNPNVASDFPVFEDRQTDAYGTSQNDYASTDETSAPGVDRSFIPTFNAPNQRQAAPSSASATYVAQNREEAPDAAPVVSSGRPLRW